MTQEGVSGADVLTWLKFNKPDVLQEAIDAVQIANEAMANEAKKRAKAPAKKAVKKTSRTGAAKKR